MKYVEFLGGSLDDLRRFPLKARRALGYQIDNLQHGFEPDDWKSMSSVGTGVCEIRVRDETGAWRAIYLARLPEAIYVLHCFQKKTQKTLKSDIDVARERLSGLLSVKTRRTK